MSGSITEVFVDIKPYGSREVTYKKSRAKVLFSLPQPEFGNRARCHVQATTDNISVIMKIGGHVIPCE